MQDPSKYCQICEDRLRWYNSNRHTREHKLCHECYIMRRALREAYAEGQRATQAFLQPITDKALMEADTTDAFKELQMEMFQTFPVPSLKPRHCPNCGSPNHEDCNRSTATI